jgi:hypothetical protein
MGGFPYGSKMGGTEENKAARKIAALFIPAPEWIRVPGG